MSKYFMSILAKEAIRNFNKGTMAFDFAGNCKAEIRHMHDKEYGVMVYDPIANMDVEILRIRDGRIAA